AYRLTSLRLPDRKAGKSDAETQETARMSVPPGNLSIMSAPELPKTRRIAGIVTTAELTAAGFSDARIRTLSRRGDLYRIARGVYAEGAHARDRLGLVGGDLLLRIAGAVAAVGPTAVVSHQSAAYLHSIDLLGKPDQTADLTVPVQRGWTAREGVR